LNHTSPLLSRGIISLGNSQQAKAKDKSLRWSFSISGKGKHFEMGKKRGSEKERERERAATQRGLVWLKSACFAW